MTAADPQNGAALSTRRRRSALWGLVSAYFVSGLGTAMSAVAIPWLVLEATGSPISTGIIGFAQMAPYVILQATAGPMVDRVGLRTAFLVGNGLAAVAIAAVPILSATGNLTLGVLAVLVAVAGAARGAADAATTPLLPIVARLAHIPIERAASLYSAGNRTALLVGLPLGGILIAAVGAANVILIDAASFIGAVLILGLVLPASLARAEGESESLRWRAYVAELAEGLRFLGADRLLLGMVAMVAATNLLDEALMSVLLPVWARDRLDSPEALGLVGGSLGLGALGGVALGAWLGPRLPRWATFAVCTFLGGAPIFFALAASTSLPLVLSVAVLSGLAGGLLNPILAAVQFERIPPRLQTRVLGTVKASAWLGIPLGSLFGGILAEHVGLTVALFASGAIMFVATLAPFVFPSWRAMERPTSDRSPSRR